MAEAVAAAATIVQLIDFSGQILSSGYGFLGKVSRAPSEIRELLTEVAGINSVLGHLEALTDSPSLQHDALASLQQLGVFSTCYEQLLIIDQIVDACRQVEGKDIQNFGRRLVWPFKEQKAKDALNKLTRLRELLSAAVDANSA
jgi:hypothetical protein